MNKKPHIHVTFKQSDRKLISMFRKSYKTREDAITAMKNDAKAFKRFHGGKVLHRKPMTEDYIEVNGTDGVTCIWQWFRD